MRYGTIYSEFFALHIGYAISECWEIIVTAVNDSGNKESAHAFLNVGGHLRRRIT